MPTPPRDQTADALAIFGVQAGPRSGEEIAVRSPVLTLGQGSQNDVVLADDSVSTTHARLEYAAGAWLLTDLGSTNGTYVEGSRLPPNAPTPLPYGSQIRFGGLRLLFNQVPAADLDAARASYTPPSAAVPVAERRGGMRVPVWIFLLLVLIFAAIAFFAVGASSQPPLDPAAALTELVPTSPGYS
ncbi:MAG: FHA domain-containing protein [Gemmatimonadetes bacterium]|nr:FHA domain-containing protein [Gemmatimonadota bacterium]